MFPAIDIVITPKNLMVGGEFHNFPIRKDFRKCTMKIGPLPASPRSHRLKEIRRAANTRDTPRKKLVSALGKSVRHVPKPLS